MPLGPPAHLLDQLYLDPRHTADAGGEWTSKRGTVPILRDFAFYPNLLTLKPGDLVLTSALRPGFVAKRITEAQIKSGFLPEHARWQHAAVYLGDENICEATRTGIASRPIDHYVGRYLLRFRRDPTLSDDERWMIVVTALENVKRRRYDFTTALWLKWKSLLAAPDLGPRKRYPRKAIVCSELYGDAYALVTGRILCRYMPVDIPAGLSETRLLEDVPVSWLHLRIP